MNTRDKLTGAAFGVGIAVAFTLIGMGIGMPAETVDVKVTECTVEDHKLANFTREQQIGDSIESKIKMKTRILSDIGELRVEREALKFELEQAESELLQLKVEIAAAERRALVAKGME